MTSTELKHQAKLQTWSAAIQECRSSGLSVKQWCKQRAVTPTTYYRWERELLALAKTEKNTMRETVAFVELPAPKHEMQNVSERVATIRINDRLFVFYKADNEENVHGILHLVRGINGKYRAVEADMNPSPYVAGVYGDSLTPKGTDWKLFSLAGDNCHNIYAVEVCYAVVDQSGMDLIRVSETYDITEANFLWIMNQENVVEELGLDDTAVARLYVDEIRMLDEEGNDITDQYKDDSATASWSAGISTAEMFLLYVYMGIVALLGLILIRFYLRRD